MHENSLDVLAMEEKRKTFNEYYPVATWPAFTAKFVLEHKVRNSKMEKYQMQLFVASQLLCISSLTTYNTLKIIKFAENINPKGSGPI